MSPRIVFNLIGEKCYFYWSNPILTCLVFSTRYYKKLCFSVWSISFIFRYLRLKIWSKTRLMSGPLWRWLVKINIPKRKKYCARIVKLVFSAWKSQKWAILLYSNCWHKIKLDLSCPGLYDLIVSKFKFEKLLEYRIPKCFRYQKKVYAPF